MSLFPVLLFPASGNHIQFYCLLLCKNIFLSIVPRASFMDMELSHTGPLAEECPLLGLLFWSCFMKFSIILLLSLFCKWSLVGVAYPWACACGYVQQQQFMCTQTRPWDSATSMHASNRHIVRVCMCVPSDSEGCWSPKATGISPGPRWKDVVVAAEYYNGWWQRLPMKERLRSSQHQDPDQEGATSPCGICRNINNPESQDRNC
jgi:hypothetical protein